MNRPKIEDVETHQKARIEKYRTWLDEKADHLRLHTTANGWSAWPLTGSYVVKLISVRQSVRDAAEESRKSAAQREKDWQNRQNRWEIERKQADLTAAFLQEVASKVFAPAFEGLGLAVLPDLAAALNVNIDDDDIPEDRSGRLAYYCRCAAFGVLTSQLPYAERKLGAAHAAAHLEGVALTWGVQLPGDWGEIAKGYEVATDE